jgi:hypothetical protein
MFESVPDSDMETIPVASLGTVSSIQVDCKRVVLEEVKRVVFLVITHHMFGFEGGSVGTLADAGHQLYF